MIKKTALSALAASAIVLSPAALANDLGGYVSAQGGYSFTRVDSQKYEIGGTDYTLEGKKSSGLAYRLSGGYSFNEHVALELGFTDYSNSDLNLADVKLAKVKPYTVELLLKGTMPINDAFFVYGKTGFAYTHVDFKESDEAFVKPRTVSSITYRPVMAAGAGYKVNEQVSVDLSYSRVFGTGDVATALVDGESADYVPNLDLLAVGVSYSF